MSYCKTVINQFNKKLHDHWPVATSLIILWISILVILMVSLKLNHGTFTYALDDAYIHLAIAKNYATYGIWGVTKYQFSSSASSILWPILISLIFLVTGVNNLVPLILNIILGSITLIIVYYILKSFKIPQKYNFMALLAVIFFAPIPYLIFIGMEHILQIILVIPFTYLSIQILIKDDYNRLNYILLIILAVFMSLVRYESLILILIISLLFLLKKKFVYSASIMIFGLIPIIIYGVISTMNGWYFLPNSLLIKSSLLNSATDASFHQLLYNYYSSLYPNTFTHQIAFISSIIATVLVLSLALFRFKNKSTIWDAPFLWLSIGGVMVLIQLLFIDNSWPLRYTSYLVVMELIALTIGLYEYISKKTSLKFTKKSIIKNLGVIVLIMLLFTPFAIKTYELSITPLATNNIYEQQYQMGMFLNTYYTGDSIAANDIGAINYYADIKCLDLVGLCSDDIATARLDGNFNAQTVSTLANEHHIKIAIIYDDWWDGNIPSNWIKVGEWTTPNSVILGNNTVSFYATSPQYADELINNLRAFSSRLPDSIKQTGIYTE